ncbi:MAG: hypothetical protein ACR2FZ_09115 [Thermoleophilaceae bacterium]|nr:hypothetical protein [Thermoleophilaceae bacterium]
MSDKTDQQKTPKPDGSAWKAHIEGLTQRNAETTKAGRKDRQEHERERAASQRASELRQMVALNKSGGPRGKSHSK